MKITQYSLRGRNRSRGASVVLIVTSKKGEQEVSESTELPSEEVFELYFEAVLIVKRDKSK